MDNLTSAKRRATPYALAVAGVLTASICFGLVPYFSRGLTDQGLTPYAVAFYRYILAAIVLLPALLKYRSNWLEVVGGLIAGAVLGLGWVGYVTALETVPASTVGVLYMTYPVFTIVIAWAFFWRSTDAAQPYCGWIDYYCGDNCRVSGICASRQSSNAARLIGCTFWIWLRNMCSRAPPDTHFPFG